MECCRVCNRGVLDNLSLVTLGLELHLSTSCTGDRETLGKKLLVLVDTESLLINELPVK